MLTRSRAPKVIAREPGFIVTVGPSATGLGTHTRWIYLDEDSDDSAADINASAPPSPPPSPPALYPPPIRASATGSLPEALLLSKGAAATPTSYSLFDGTLSSLPTSLGSPISLGSSMSFGASGLRTPPSSSLNVNNIPHGTSYRTLSSLSCPELRPTPVQPTTTPPPLPAGVPSDLETDSDCRMVNGVYTCSCLDVPSTPPLASPSFPVTPPPSMANQGPTSHLNAPRKQNPLPAGQGLRYFNQCSEDEGSEFLMDWGDSFSTVESLNTHRNRQHVRDAPIRHESMTQAHMEEIIAREMDILLSQRGRAVLEDAEMSDSEDGYSLFDSESERGSIDTPITESGFGFGPASQFYLRGDTVEAEEPPKRRGLNGGLYYQDTEIVDHHETLVVPANLGNAAYSDAWKRGLCGEPTELIYPHAHARQS